RSRVRSPLAPAGRPGARVACGSARNGRFPLSPVATRVRRFTRANLTSARFIVKRPVACITTPQRGSPLVSRAGRRYHPRPSTGEVIAMECTVPLSRLKPLAPPPAPAYHDGVPPKARRVRPTGEIAVDWPVVKIPASLCRLHTISIEALEDELERE